MKKQENVIHNPWQGKQKQKNNNINSPRVDTAIRIIRQKF